MAANAYVAVVFRFPKGMKPPWLGKHKSGGATNYYDLSPLGVGKSTDVFTSGAGPFKNAIACMAVYGDDGDIGATLTAMEANLAAMKTGNP